MQPIDNDRPPAAADIIKVAMINIHRRLREEGRGALVAAWQGQLESLRMKCQAQRQKVERKQTTGYSTTIAAGLILIH